MESVSNQTGRRGWLLLAFLLCPTTTNLLAAEKAPSKTADNAVNACCAVPAAASDAQPFQAEGPVHFFGNLFNSADYPSRWYCGTWSADVGWLHILSDLAIFAAYFAIPMVLLYFLWRKPDLAFPNVGWLFAAFILLCGLTHLVEAGIFWWPVYRFSGLLKFATAVVSCVTVFTLFKIIPQALKLPSTALLATQLKASGQRLAIAMNAAHIGVLEWNVDQQVFEVDPSGASMLELPAGSEAVSMRQLAQCLHPEGRDATIAALTAAVTSVDQFEREFRTANSRHVRLQGHCVDSVGEPRFVGVCLDVTKQKQIQRDALTVKEQAEAASRAKSDFLANMSHEIRTPLGGILGFTDLLRRDIGQPQEQREYIDTIHSSGQHLLRLINDILDLSKIEAGRMEFEQAACSPTEIIHDVLSIMNIKAQEKGLRLECQWTTPAPAVIQTDAARLRQLLVNLVGNALKFTHEGKIVVRAAIEDLGPEPRLVIQVEDTGIGIASDQIKRIFQPFDQADTSITRRFGGTGLGLTISRHIAEGLGGELTVQSEAGQGCTFTASIATGPLIDLHFERDVSTSKVETSTDALALPHTHDLTGLRVLVVDDGETNRRLISLVLSEAGAEVVGAANGEQGVAAYHAGKFDLLLMDMQMPVMDGYQASKQLRDSGCQTPIIALTAHAMRGDREKCMEAGCSDYLTKPIDIAELFSALERNRVRPHGSPSTTCDESQGNVSIRSTLPMDMPEYQQIAEDFLARLEHQLEVMSDAIANDDWETLGKLAHWLKGSGGTLGFDCLTEPANQLEQASRNQDAECAAAKLAEIASLCLRMEVC